MAIVNCGECGKAVSTLAVACPSCGAPQQSQPAPIALDEVTIGGKHVLGVALVLIIAVGIAIKVFGGGPNQEVASAAARPPLKVDLDSFYVEGRANEVALQERLKDHDLEIHGFVGDIVTSMGTPEVEVVTKGGNFKASMPTSAAATLSKDQEVEVVCESITYAGTQGSRGSDCRLSHAGNITPGISHELERARNNSDANEFAKSVLTDAAKNILDDVKGVAGKAPNSASPLSSPISAPPQHLNWAVGVTISGTLRWDSFDDCCSNGQSTRTRYLAFDPDSPIVVDPQERYPGTATEAHTIQIATDNIEAPASLPSHVEVTCKSLEPGETGHYAQLVYCTGATFKTLP